MNRSALAITLAGISILSPAGIEAVTITDEILEEKERERLELEKAEMAKLEILEKEGKLAEERLKELERIKNVTFDKHDIRKVSGLKTHEIKELLSGTNMEALAPAFVDAETIYNVNALALCGIVAVESAWNTSRRALEQYNLTGYAVYSDSSIGKDFASPYHCILETARLLKEDYLSTDGMWHNGFGLSHINIMYSSDNEWYNKVGKIGLDLLERYKNSMEVKEYKW